MDTPGTSQSQIVGFQPCHILKGWSWARDSPVLPPRFLPGVTEGGPALPMAGAKIDLLRVYVPAGGEPPK